MATGAKNPGTAEEAATASPTEPTGACPSTPPPPSTSPTLPTPRCYHSRVSHLSLRRAVAEKEGNSPCGPA